MDSIDDLSRQIRLGEDSELELKRVLLVGARVTISRQCNRNELIVSLLACCPLGADQGFGRSNLKEGHGGGVQIILEESDRLSGHAPEHSLTEGSAERHLIWASAGRLATPAEKE